MTALAGAVAAAVDHRLRPGLLTLAAAAAALGTTCRTEAAAATGLMALLLVAARWKGAAGALPRRIAAAGALLAGVLLGVALTLALSWRLRGTAQLGSPTYLFYTFYDGLPWLMRPRILKLPSEYGRYLASADLFGGFDANHGSVRAALFAHPGKAILRFVLKVPDLVAGASTVRGLTPLGIPLAILGLLRVRGVGAVATQSRAPLLLAFLGPIALLMIPPASDFYLLAAVFPVLLAIAAGLEAVLARLTESTFRRAMAASLLVATATIVLVGRTQRSSSRTVNAAGAYLEKECRTGCLTNYLPESLAGLVWRDVEAGAPLPRKIKRSEPFVTGRFPAGFAEGCRFDARLREARRRVYDGPILYADFRVGSARLFSDQFDPERRLEGAVDVSRAKLRQRFDDGGDSIAIYELSLSP